MSGLIDELKRRNVFKVGAAYVVLAWLLAQITDVFLENFGAPDWVIKTVLMLLLVGLPISLFFAWAFEMTPDGIKKEKDVDRSQSITPQTGRKLDFTIIAVLLLALAYFTYDKFVMDPAQDAALLEIEQAAALATQAAEPIGKSIAVLPFVNMSSDKEQEYFSDGISEEILNALAKVKGLQVAGRTSSFAFKGENQDLRQIGKTLGVDHILEGSVRKAGATVRITAQLIRVDNGFHLWSETYDRELVDVFAIQDEIAGAILTQLKAQLIGEELQVVTATRTNSEAYDLYLLARQRLYERTGPTIQSASDLLDKAIALDANYAPAYAQRAIATMLLSEGGGTYGDIPLDQALAQSRLYLDKAIELDPNLAEAWAGLGLHYYKDTTPGSTYRAVEMLEKALAINPGLINASNWLHNSFVGLGKPREAHVILKNMVERDPLYRPGIRNAINMYTGLGEHDEAWALLERIRPLVPNDAIFRGSEASIYLSLGQLAQANQQADAALALGSPGSVTRGTYREILLKLGRHELLAEMNEGWEPVYAMVMLDRSEDAVSRAYKRANELADVATLFNTLNLTNRSAELIAYLEERWTDLDALRQDFPPYGTFGDFLMLDVALAYSRVGQQEQFDDAMSRIREAHQQLESIGANNIDFFMNQASYFALAGDLVSSMENLDRAASLGQTGPLRLAIAWPALEPLEGDPRYEAIQLQMIEHLNTEREKLGLGPATI